MAKKCELYGTGVTSGNTVSHSKQRTRTTWLPNLQEKKYFLPELGKSVKLKLSTKAIRTINKFGGLTGLLRATPDSELPKKFKSMKDQIISTSK